MKRAGFEIMLIGVAEGKSGAVAALGENLILLVNLAWSAWLYARFVSRRGAFSPVRHDRGRRGVDGGRREIGRGLSLAVQFCRRLSLPQDEIGCRARECDIQKNRLCR